MQMRRNVTIILLAVFLTAAIPAYCLGADPVASTPLLSVGLGNGDNHDQISVVLQIFILMTVLSLAPSILIMLTSFVRIAIVLSLLRQAMGTHQMPPNQVIIGLSLFLTFFVMSPVIQNVNTNALQPWLSKEISQEKALEKAAVPIKAFMFRQTREKDLALLVNISGAERPRNADDVTLTVLIPSFIISELKTAFQIGFMLYIPFLVIDMVVASVLLSMGMMMLPPIMVSLPFKLMIFVLTDGWHLIIGSIVKSFA